MGLQMSCTSTVEWESFFFLMKNNLPKTNSSHLKMDGWNTHVLLGRPIFNGELLVSGSVLVVIVTIM